MYEKLGELLVKNNVITSESLNRALDTQRKDGGLIGSILVKQGILSENLLLQFLSEQYNVPTIKLSDFDIDPAAIKFVSSDIAIQYKALPVSIKNSSLIVAMVDPSNIFALDDLKFLTGYRIEPVVASEKAIMSAIDENYKSASGLDSLISDYDAQSIEYIEDEAEIVDIDSLAEQSEDAPVVRLVNAVLTDAIGKNCSDIHIEPFEKSFRIRFRIDGSLYDVMHPPLSMKNAITSRIKIMSKMDIAERRLPQDGRIKLKLGKGKEMDYRVSVLPTLFGEKVVLRLLDKENLQLDMTKLGFNQSQLNHFQEAIHKPFGMVLVTGPTGSGKTTTLYSALSELNKITENISTAEDPVEFNLEGINQVQVHEEIGLTFAAALRSFLRQDPDIILVGEIRDFETAEIAIKAALTGHLVLSTLHTNDAPSTITRLINMGIEPFLVSSSVNLILAQRLARKICSNCKEKTDHSSLELEKLGILPQQYEGAEFFRGAGCEICNDTGYKGRIALYEVMPITDPIKELVLQGASAIEIKREAVEQGMETLRQSAVAKFLAGTITYEEVLKTTVKDE